MKRLYVIAPLALMAAFTAAYLPYSQSYDEKAAAAREQLARDERAQQLERENAARDALAAAQARQRAREEARADDERRARETLLADDARARGEAIELQRDQEELAAAVAALRERREAARAGHAAAERDALIAQRELEAQIIARRNVELELQRTAELLTDRFAVLCTLEFSEPPPARPRARPRE